TRVMRGWAVASLGRHDVGLAELRQGLQGLQRMGQLHNHGFLLGLLADAYAQSGALAEALAVLEDALVALGSEEGDKPDLLRLRADLLSKQCADPCTVEVSYREAIDLAHRQGARALELRALTSFGRWLRSNARSEEARALLAPLYASFTERLETRDLREAKTLLEDRAERAVYGRKGEADSRRGDRPQSRTAYDGLSGLLDRQRRQSSSSLRTSEANRNGLRAAAASSKAHRPVATWM